MRIALKARIETARGQSLPWHRPAVPAVRSCPDYADSVRLTFFNWLLTVLRLILPQLTLRTADQSFQRILHQLTPSFQLCPLTDCSLCLLTSLGEDGFPTDVVDLRANCADFAKWLAGRLRRIYGNSNNQLWSAISRKGRPPDVADAHGNAGVQRTGKGRTLHLITEF